MHYVWGINYGPPSPVTSISTIKNLLDYVTTNVSPDIINIGFPTIGYDWELPYIPGKSSAHSLSLDAAVNLARDTGASIQFDDISQTPYFQYMQFGFGNPVQHIVWFIDARSIEALVKLVSEYRLAGTGIWNIMIYYPQLWLVINSQYDIVKFIE